MGDRLPLNGLAQMDLHAALQRKRRADEAVRKAIREQRVAEGEVARCERALGLNQMAAYSQKAPDTETTVTW